MNDVYDQNTIARLRELVNYITFSKSSDHSFIMPKQSSTYNYSLDDTRRWDGWGYEDTKLFINNDGEIELSGQRYQDIFSNSLYRVFPSLRKWAETEIGLDIKRMSIPQIQRTSSTIDRIQSYELTSERQEVLKEFIESIQGKYGISGSLDIYDRIDHSHGQTCEEIYLLRNGPLPFRLPDAVVYPQNHQDVVHLVARAWQDRLKLCLIPHGGGTNVTQALVCEKHEERAIVSIDMRQMTRIISLDAENRIAVVEAGITGLALHEKLAHRGFTLGHEPDSWEFSTLGGWVATRASGMKKNKYGNIEDVVLNVVMVTGTNDSTSEFRPSGGASNARVSMGPDLKSIVLGSEGTLGIITQVTIQLQPLASVRRYASFVFPDFSSGIEMLYETQHAFTTIENLVPPASIRLLDNTQFRLGQAMKPKGVGYALLEAAKRYYVTEIKGFSVNNMCAATVLVEGTDLQVLEKQLDIVERIAKKHRGLPGGEENGKRGYHLTYLIAYLRDFAMNYYFLSESFETCVPWTAIRGLIADLRHMISQLAQNAGVMYPPLIASRISQMYHSGVCVYVYYGLNYYGMKSDPIELFKQVEKVAVQCILNAGGSLSHHHGIGKHRRHWLPQQVSQPGVLALQGIKKALDPANLFGVGNLLEYEQQSKL